MKFSEFQAIVTAAGLSARQCSSEHWRIEGGNWPVNYYPSRGTIHVNGQNKRNARGATVSEAIIAAKADKPAPTGVRSERKQCTREKLRLLEKHPFCFWCEKAGIQHKPLTRATATIEHVIPLIHGGSNGGDNLKLAHSRCNTLHGEGAFFGLTPDELRAVILGKAEMAKW